MASHDVESLFTSISLEENTENKINDLFLTTDKVHNLERENLNNFLLWQCMNHFSFLMKNIKLKLMVLLWDPLQV